MCSYSPRSSSLLGIMAADSLVPLSHRCTIQIVGSFQNGVLAELLLESQHRILQLFLFFQLSCVQMCIRDRTSAPRPKERNKFFSDLEKKEFIKMEKKYAADAKIPLKQKVKNILRNALLRKNNGGGTVR